MARYIRKRFHFLQQGKRRKAQALVNKVPLLSVRPMLLTHIPDLIDEDVKVEFSFQLYEILVNKWYEREKGRRRAFRVFYRAQLQVLQKKHEGWRALIAQPQCGEPV